MDPGYIHSMCILLRLSTSNRDFFFIQFERRSLEKNTKFEKNKRITSIKPIWVRLL